MPIIELANYQNGGTTFINVDKVLYFNEISYNGRNGTELRLTDGRTFITAYYPDKVKKIIEEAENGNGIKS